MDRLRKKVACWINLISWEGMNVLLPAVTSMMAIGISSSVTPNLIEQKACSPLVEPPINEFICNDMSILADISELAVTKNILKSLCSAVSTAAFGYWRDASGLSRSLLMIGSIAEILSTTADYLAAVDWQRSPWIATMLEAGISGLFGKSVFLLGANCIIITTSSVEQRTIRLQIFMTSVLMASLVASATSGFFLTAVGYRWVFATGIMLHILTLLIILTFVEDVKMERVQKEKGALHQLPEVFKLRPNISVIWLMLLCGSVISSIFPGENSLVYYYLQQRFHFTVHEISLYNTYVFGLSVFGSFIMAVFITQVLKWSDLKFGILASFFTLLLSLATGLANTPYLLILSAPLSIMRINLLSIPQSIISKCIKRDELGVFIGIGSILGIFVMFFFNYLLDYVFSLTSQTMPGAFFFVSAGGYAFILILFSICTCLFKPTELDTGCPTTMKN